MRNFFQKRRKPESGAIDKGEMEGGEMEGGEMEGVVSFMPPMPSNRGEPRLAPRPIADWPHAETRGVVVPEARGRAGHGAGQSQGWPVGDDRSAGRVERFERSSTSARSPDPAPNPTLAGGVVSGPVGGRSGGPSTGERGSERAAVEGEVPRFSLPVSGGLRAGAAALTGMTPEINATLREAFTPTRPKQRVNSLFVGRLATLKRIIQAIEEERAHVVLFGDRGRGKTSLANAVQQIASQAGYLTLKLTCSAELTFEDIFRNFLRHIPSSYYRAGQDSPFAGRRNFANFNELLPQGAFSVTELHDVLASLQGAHGLFILDEYDRILDEDLRTKLAELIKNMTDSAIPVTLLVVGVAENLDQLLGKHPSIQRSLVAVHLPLMTDREIERIMLAGAESAGITFSPEVREGIIGFAKGLPYYAQLLGLHAARSAVSRASSQVMPNDLAYALNRCVQEAERGVVDLYNRTLAGEAGSMLADALYAAAQCQSDEFGTFTMADMAKVSLGTTGQGLSEADLRQALELLSADERAGVLQRIIGPGHYRYRFRNQMMRQYVLMRQAEDRGVL